MLAITLFATSLVLPTALTTTAYAEDQNAELTQKVNEARKEHGMKPLTPDEVKKFYDYVNTPGATQEDQDKIDAYAKANPLGPPKTSGGNGAVNSTGTTDNGTTDGINDSSTDDAPDQTTGTTD
jgi:hypothetical protein